MRLRPAKLAALLTLGLAAACSTTPTGRSQLILVGDADMDRMGATAFAQVKAGGKDNGAPGERPYHPGYYGAFVLDPDGNNIEVVYHGPANYSADSVKVSF